METPSLFPGISCVVIVNRLSVRSDTGRAPSSAPVRIFGPCKSARIPTGFRWRPEVARINVMVRACSSWVPWEKFRRATSMPARIKWSMTVGEWLAGPRVQTILARRTWAAFQLFCDEFMNRLVQEVDACAEAGDGDAFVVAMHAQKIRLGQRKGNQSVRLHIMNAQIGRIGVPRR